MMEDIHIASSFTNVRKHVIKKLPLNIENPNGILLVFPPTILSIEQQAKTKFENQNYLPFPRKEEIAVILSLKLFGNVIRNSENIFEICAPTNEPTIFYPPPLSPIIYMKFKESPKAVINDQFKADPLVKMYYQHNGNIFDLFLELQRPLFGYRLFIYNFQFRQFHEINRSEGLYTELSLRNYISQLNITPFVFNNTRIESPKNVRLNFDRTEDILLCLPEFVQSQYKISDFSQNIPRMNINIRLILSNFIEIPQEEIEKYIKVKCPEIYIEIHKQPVLQITFLKSPRTANRILKKRTIGTNFFILLIKIQPSTESHIEYPYIQDLDNRSNFWKFEFNFRKKITEKKDPTVYESLTETIQASKKSRLEILSSTAASLLGETELNFTHNSLSIESDLSIQTLEKKIIIRQIIPPSVIVNRFTPVRLIGSGFSIEGGLKVILCCDKHEPIICRSIIWTDNHIEIFLPEHHAGKDRIQIISINFPSISSNLVDVCFVEPKQNSVIVKTSYINNIFGPLDNTVNLEITNIVDEIKSMDFLI